MTLDRVDSGMRHLYSCRADVLRLNEGSIAGGRPVVSYEQVADQVDPYLDENGELLCRIDLTFIRPGKTAVEPSKAGGRIPRVGTLFCDVTPNLLMGDRLSMQAGSAVMGTFELRVRPDVVAMPFGGSHIEAEIVEVAKTGTSAAGVTDPLAATGPSWMRYLYDTRAAVYRKNDSGLYEKLTSVVDSLLVVDGNQIAGELMCQLSIGFTRPGKFEPTPIVAGRAPDRIGVMFCDITSELQAEDRIVVLSGPNLGTFELRQAPDLAQASNSSQHIEVEIIECAQSLRGTFVE